MIRKVENKDIEQICNIYNYYIDNTTITFEERPISIEEMKSRIDEVRKKYIWLVIEEEGQILGYAYISEWKSRSAYKHTAESSVYLNHEFLGKKIGTQLYESIINQAKEIKLHCLIGGIALPNEKSVALHEKFGFIKVAQFKEVGYKFEQWIDVGYWELFL